MIRLKRYIPYTYYTQLPTNPEDIDDFDDLDGSDIVPKRKSKKSFCGLRHLRLAHRLRIIFIVVVIAITVVLVILIRKSKNRRPKWTAPIYNFDTESRPAWMFVNSSSSSVEEPPLSLRVAVLSYSEEVERRQLIRDNMFRGVRPNEVRIDYRFLVGRPNGWFGFGNKHRLEELRQEEQKYGDMVILDLKESKYRLSEKRYHGLKWSNSFSNTSYDYFMTLDSDTFVRFGALARRLPSVLEGRNIKPREQPVIIARMSPHSRYWLTSVSDEKKDTTEEDVYLDGPTFLYPIGIGYMLSSSLVQTLLTTQYPLPHHIHYPYDDVMVGSWLASLKNFAEPHNVFTKPPKHFWDDAVRVHPPLLLETPLETTIVNDLGWHDYPGRAYVNEINGAIGWNSVCVHHIQESEIKMMRQMKEFEGEWDDL